MFGDDDLSIFYAADEGAVEFTLVGSSPVQSFLAHKGEADQEALQDYAVARVTVIHYPTAAIVLHQDDEITAGTETWRVLRDPRVANDGAESTAYLVPA